MKTRTFIPLLATEFLLSTAMLLSSPSQGVAQETSASPSGSTARTADAEFGDGVVAELLSVTRGENDVTVKFKYTNNGSKACRFEMSNYSHQNIAALVYYIDPKNKKKYTAI